MSELLNSGSVGLTTLRTQAAQRKTIIENWDKSGLLEGLNGSHKSNIAQLLENQASQMLTEVTLDSSAGRFDTVAFPMVRRIFSRLLANEIVSVQPLALPSGLLFYMDARVSTNKVAPANTANGQGGPTMSTTSAYERFYNNFGVNGSGQTASFGTATTIGLTQVTKSSGDTTDGLISMTVDLGANFDVNKQQSSSTLRFIATGNVVYNGSTVIAAGAKVPFYSQMQKWGQDQFDSRNAQIILDIRPAGVYGADFNTALLQDFAVIPYYEVFNDLEAKSEMSELTIRFSSVTVNTTTRKMRAHWTPELAQDLEAYHSIDAEAELTALLSEEIAAEIDREIIIDLVNGAMFLARWDYAGLKNNANFFGTQKDWNQTLITRVNEISAQIHKATLRGGANWVIVSAEAGAIFDDLEYFHVEGSAQPEAEKYNLGIEKIGNLGSRYVVYKDPYLPSDIVLVGHKGNTFLEAGYIYAPYIPLQLTQVIYDPNDFTPRKGILTRYSKKMVNNRFYGVIKIDNINTYQNVYSAS
jgi:hypothetical protein